MTGTVLTLGVAIFPIPRPCIVQVTSKKFCRQSCSSGYCHASSMSDSLHRSKVACTSVIHKYPRLRVAMWTSFQSDGVDVIMGQTGGTGAKAMLSWLRTGLRSNSNVGYWTHQATPLNVKNCFTGGGSGRRGVSVGSPRIMPAGHDDVCKRKRRRGITTSGETAGSSHHPCPGSGTRRGKAGAEPKRDSSEQTVRGENEKPMDLRDRVNNSDGQNLSSGVCVCVHLRN